MLGGYGVCWLLSVIRILHNFRLSMMHKGIEYTISFSTSVYTCHMTYFFPLTLQKQPIASNVRICVPLVPLPKTRIIWHVDD